jgi:hypothetical protein
MAKWTHGVLIMDIIGTQLSVALLRIDRLKEANRLLEREVKETQQQLTDARIRIKELLKEMNK